jgi:hypothetical protein
MPLTSLAELTHPYQAARGEIIELVRPHTREELRQKFASDPLLANFLVNHWEFAHGVAECTSYPWNVVIPISDVCNASCSFCNAWLRGKRLLRLEELDRFEPLLRHAAMLGLEGHGEPLVHPQFEQIVRRLQDMIDPRCRSYIITNAWLLEEKFSLLQDLGINVYNISLNAASAPTHHRVMHLGERAFHKIVRGIRRLIELKERNDLANERAINLSMVVTSENIHEAAAFVRLANELGATQANLRTLLPAQELLAGLNYHLLPPYLHPDFERHRREAVEAIAQSRVPVAADPASWSNPVLPESQLERIRREPPPVLSRAEGRKLVSRLKEEFRWYAETDSRGEPCAGGQEGPFQAESNFDDVPSPFGRTSPYQCWDVYSVFHMNDFYFLLRPCCYLDAVPGYRYVKFDGSYDFFAAWNSPAMVALRRSLKEGPLLGMCRRCAPQPQFVPLGNLAAA